jgi:hypothetical protein
MTENDHPEGSLLFMLVYLLLVYLLLLALFWTNAYHKFWGG